MTPAKLFLPVKKEDLAARGWDGLDIILVTGDAYVDHPSFAMAILGRVLESKGYRVGIIAQPDWTSLKDFQKLGRPRLYFGVSAGNLDSLVSNYTPNKKKRRSDAYSPGGKAGCRPDRATIVYANRLHEAYPGVPIVIGGIEASLRRFAHYDYWSDKVRRSLLFDAKADLLLYGMGERQVVRLAELLAKGVPMKKITDIRGSVYKAKELPDDCLILPSYEEVKADKASYAKAVKLQYLNQNPFIGKRLAQKHGDQFLIQNIPDKPLSTEELDKVYELPYQRDYHPDYEAEVPAIREVKFSLLSQRGCFGGCAFCAITHHQGRMIQARSAESLLREAKILTELPDFKGIIHDVGGPTANFRHLACPKQEKHGACVGKECLYPAPCPNLEVDHSEYFALLKKIRSLPKVKKVFIRSGIRYDYLLEDKRFFKYLEELCKHYVSGQLKVAPEHIAPNALAMMHKSGRRVFDRFRECYEAMNKKLGKKQYLVPYFMSSHPGCTLKDAVLLAEYIRDLHYQPEQVQDFTPTPGSLSTCMYYTGLDPLTGKKVHVPDEKERTLQRALLQYKLPANRKLVEKALQKAGRQDLIGWGPKALLRPVKSDRTIKTVRRKKR